MLQHWPKQPRSQSFFSFPSFPCVFPNLLPSFLLTSFMLFPGLFQREQEGSLLLSQRKRRKCCSICSASSVLGWLQQYQDLGCSGRTLVASLSIPDPPDGEGHLLPVPQHRTQRVQTQCIKMKQGRGRNPPLTAQEGLGQTNSATWLKTEPKFAAHGGRLGFLLPQRTALVRAGHVLCPLLSTLSSVPCSWREVDISALKANPDEDNEEVRRIL